MLNKAEGKTINYKIVCNLIGGELSIGSNIALSIGHLDLRNRREIYQDNQNYKTHDT